MALITLKQAMDHLRLTDEDAAAADEDLKLKMEQASAIVLDYVSSSTHWATIAAAWTYDTLPAVVQAAMLLQLGELYQFRGDDPERDRPQQEAGQLSPQVRNLLTRYHDPAIA